MCEWMDNQCIEAIKTPKINSNSCYLQTGGTHSWHSKQCQICRGNNNHKNSRILAEALNLPTFTQSSKQYITTWSSTKYFQTTLKNVINQTSSSLITSTYICYADDCSESKISKEQQFRKIYTRQKWDILSSYEQKDILCSTDSRILKNGNTYNATNYTTHCLETTSDLYYTNGIKTSATTQKANKTENCQILKVFNSTTVGNSFTKCHCISNVSSGLSWFYTDVCDTDDEAQIYPDTSNSSQQFTFTTKAKSCNRIHADILKSPIDTITHTISIETSIWGERHEKEISINCKWKKMIVQQISHQNFQQIIQLIHFLMNQLILQPNKTVKIIQKLNNQYLRLPKSLLIQHQSNKFVNRTTNYKQTLESDYFRQNNNVRKCSELASQKYFFKKFFLCIMILKNYFWPRIIPQNIQLVLIFYQYLKLVSFLQYFKILSCRIFFNV